MTKEANFITPNITGKNNSETISTVKLNNNKTLSTIVPRNPKAAVAIDQNTLKNTKFSGIIEIRRCDNEGKISNNPKDVDRLIFNKGELKAVATRSFDNENLSRVPKWALEKSTLLSQSKTFESSYTQNSTAIQQAFNAKPRGRMQRVIIKT